MVQNGLKWFELVQTSVKWFKLNQTGSNWFKLIHTSSTWFKLVQIGSSWFKRVQTGSNQFKPKLVQTSSNWLKLGPTSANWLKLVQTGLSWVKLVQKGSECFKLIKMVQTCSNLFKPVQTVSNCFKMDQTGTKWFPKWSKMVTENINNPKFWMIINIGSTIILLWSLCCLCYLFVSSNFVFLYFLSLEFYAVNFSHRYFTPIISLPIFPLQKYLFTPFFLHYFLSIHLLCIYNVLWWFPPILRRETVPSLTSDIWQNRVQTTPHNEDE